MSNKNNNLELDAITLVSNSYRTAGVIIAEKILFGKTFESKEELGEISLLSSDDVDAAFNESLDLDEAQKVGEIYDDLLYFKKAMVLVFISDYSFQLAKLGSSNSLNEIIAKSIRWRMIEALNDYKEFSNYDIDKLMMSAKKTAGRLLDMFEVRRAIIDVANVLQTKFLTADQKRKAIAEIVKLVKPRSYIDFQSTLSFFSHHYPSLEEFYIFDMEYHDTYPTFWMSK